MLGHDPHRSLQVGLQFCNEAIFLTITASSDNFWPRKRNLSSARSAASQLLPHMATGTRMSAVLIACKHLTPVQLTYNAHATGLNRHSEGSRKRASPGISRHGAAAHNLTSFGNFNELVFALSRFAIKRWGNWAREVRKCGEAPDSSSSV